MDALALNLEFVASVHELISITGSTDIERKLDSGEITYKQASDLLCARIWCP